MSATRTVTRVRKTIQRKDESINNGGSITVLKPKAAAVSIFETKVSFDDKRKLVARLQQFISELPKLAVDGFRLNLYNQKILLEEKVVKVESQDKEGPLTVDDKKMGVTKNDDLCATCQQDNLNCPGHKGIIRLPERMYHPQCIPEIIMVLNSVCNDCGNLFFTEDELKRTGILRYTGKNRLKKIEKLALDLDPTKSCCRKKHEGNVLACKPNRCYDSKNAVYGQISYRARTSKTKSGKLKNCKDQKGELAVMSVEDIYKILDGISDEDAKLLGYSYGSHPRDLVLNDIIVIPPVARQPAFINDQQKPNDITQAYHDLISKRNELKKILDQERATVVSNKKDKELKSNKYRRLLFFFYSHLIDNSDGKYGSSRGRPINSIKKLMQGKESLMRGLLMGKKVNFVLRTVAGPDPLMKFGEVGIPEIVMQEQTRPIFVTRYNIRQLSKEWRVPGENSLIKYITFGPYHDKKRGLRKKVNDKLRNYPIKIGDILERHMIDGDVGPVNRQPTLHKQSMMSHRAKSVPGKVLRLHMSETTPYNADFDGDEMSYHNIQTTDAVVEAQQFANVIDNIINPQTNRPIMAAVYDMLDGSYYLTSDNTFIDISDRQTYLNILTSRDQLESYDSRLQQAGVNPLSGKAIYSALFPVDFYFNEGGVVIRNGIMIKGTTKKKHIGTVHFSIIQRLHKGYGKIRTAKFLTDLPYLINHWFVTIGFSIGLEDVLPPDNRMEELVAETINIGKLKIESLGPKPDNKLDEEVHEKKIRSALREISEKIRDNINKTLPDDNPLNIMTSSGAKGDGGNVMQIMALMGQQFYMASIRHPMVITNKTRVLPYFSRNDPNMEARGFVGNNLLKGLNPADYYFAAEGGRQGLIDTALKTAETGYLHRSLVKVLEDIQVATDGSVRNANNTLFEQSYGEDGFDASELENVEYGNGVLPFFINLENTATRLNSLLFG